MSRRAHVAQLVLIALIAAGCGTTRQSGISTIKTLHEVGDAAPYGNVLVIGVAGEVPDRVRFEQELVNALAGEKAAVTPFYTIVGRNPQLSRGLLNNVIRAREFDAIILTRTKGQELEELDPNRPTGRGFDLFRYEYEELNSPTSIPTGSTVSFLVEFYDAESRKKIWAIESLVFDAGSVDAAVTAQVAAIAAEIRKDGLVRP